MNNGLSTLTAYAPPWVKPTLSLMYIYAIINFLIVMGQLWAERSVARGDGFTMFPLAARAFSGHWMLFYLLPAVYFIYGEKPKLKRKPEWEEPVYFEQPDHLPY